MIVYSKVDKTSTEVYSKYTDFTNTFLPKLALELSKYMDINNHAILEVDNWQLLYSLIYSLDQIKSEILKTCIKNNLANNFIRFFKFFVGASILFDKKSDKNQIDYQDFHNFRIKNRYSLLLVIVSLDTLGGA